MELTIVIARIAAVMFVAVGLGGLFNKDYYVKIAKETMSSYGIALCYGVMVIVMSGLMIAYHNIWTGWPVVITLMGWMGMAKGIMFLVKPSLMRDFSLSVFENKLLAKIMPYTTMLMGLVLGYLGWFVG
ncbi:hypothetical protein ACFL0V_05710 [Nanoarchaeota archaeon]